MALLLININNLLIVCDKPMTTAVYTRSYRAK